MYVFEKLKIYGFKELEDVILAGLVTGDPLLLVGSHGSAKTLLVRRLSQALGLNFIAYDASKALFEDVLGFPNPDSLSKGVVDYVSTPISIWDKEFVLIDEISRATPSMQNKWLEIIRSRQLMGKRIPKLKYVFAAMNPPGRYIGAMPLDHALAGRFAFIVEVPEIHQFNTDDVLSVIENISEDDATAARIFDKEKEVDINDELKELIEEAQQYMVDIRKKYRETITRYTMNIFRGFLRHGLKLDGRRLGMIRRNLMAYLSIKMAKTAEMNDVYRYFLECLCSSLPYNAVGEPVKKEVIEAVHLYAVKNINAPLKREFISFTDDMPATEIVERYIKLYSEMDELEHDEMVRTIQLRLNEATTAEELAQVYVATEKLVKFYQSKTDGNYTDKKRRIMDIYMSMMRLTNFNNRYPHMPELKLDGVTEDIFSDIAFRLILNANERISHRDDCNEFYETLKEKLKNFLTKGGTK